MHRLTDFLFNGTDHPGHKRIVRWMWFALIGGLVALCIFFVVLSFSNLPSVKQLENPKSEIATQVYGIDGNVIGRLYTENRVPVEYGDLSPHLVNALISTEDEDYYQHSGIDFSALGRVMVKTVILQQQSAGGGSTITQQLAKLLFTGRPGSGLERVLQKFKEWIIAVRLERKYTKEEIIAMYLNKFNFINGAYGIKAASEVYFSKSQDSLNIQEAAMLVGMLQNPSLYNPFRYPEKTLKRREVVLKQMQKNGHFSKEAYDQLRQTDLGLHPRRETHIDGIATYFRSVLAQDVKAILAKPENRKSDGEPYDIYRDGLKIYTTIDPAMQRIAENAMIEHMTNVQKTFDREWGKTDPWTYMKDPEKEISLELRQEKLKRMIRNTDRYQRLRDKYLGKILEDFEAEFPNFTFNIDDREIERIVREAQEPGYITSLVQRGLISNNLAAAYRRVLKSKDFNRLKTDWRNLQQATEQVFSTPAKMRVFTYENPKLEKDTTMTPLDSIKYHSRFLQTGILVVDPHTGYVKVWVGGINFKYFQYDHVRTDRQVGSTFKPFIYATAIQQQGISPCFQVYDIAQTIQPGEGNFYLKEPWTPENFSGKYTHKLYTLKDGLRNSVNTVSVYLMKQLGNTDPVRGLVHNMGIDSSARYPNGIFRVPQSPSIALGAATLNVMEMTGAYTTFANNGIHNQPVYILRIEDRNGSVIYSGIQEEKRALSPSANYAMIDMLQYSARIGGLKSQIAGKTGTTNNHVDGWFMGLTPDLVVGTWVGGEDAWIRFRLPYNGQGSRMAKPFFAAFIKQLEDEEQVDYNPDARFFRPPGPIGIELDCNEYDQENLDGLEEDPLQGDDFTEDMFGDQFLLEMETPPDTTIRQQ